MARGSLKLSYFDVGEFPGSIEVLYHHNLFLTILTFDPPFDHQGVAYESTIYVRVRLFLKIAIETLELPNIIFRYWQFGSL